MSRKGVDPKPVFAEVYSYLQSLYDSVAETLPLDDKRKGGVWSEDVDDYKICPSAKGPEELRYLPPGTIYDLWRQFNSTSGQKCSWHTFHSCWSNEFVGKLTFRDKYLFSVCPVCVQHKLLI